MFQILIDNKILSSLDFSSIHLILTILGASDYDGEYYDQSSKFSHQMRPFAKYL